MIDKCIKDGMVGVLISYGYGAGFSTWNSIEGIEFEPHVIQMIEEGKSEEDIISYLEGVYPEAYWGGVEGLNVIWLKQGTEFKITEYDGTESIEFKEDNYWKVA